MQGNLEILSGARAGSIVPLAAGQLLVGRDPQAWLRFDPHNDLAVSTRHAMLTQTNQGWVVADLASRNGTYVNGRRIQGEAQLASGDVIQFGEHGPRVRLTDTTGAAAAPVGEGPRPSPKFAPDQSPRARVDSGQGITRLVRSRVAKETRRLRLVAFTATAVLAVAFVGAVLWGGLRADAGAREIATMQAQVDSILAVNQDMEQGLLGENAGLRSELGRSQERLSQVQSRLERARTAPSEEPADLTDLRRELLAARTALRRQQLASNLDYERLERISAPAVARIFVQFNQGETFAATAFAVDSSGLLVTSRHVVEDDDGNPASRIGVEFTGSTQVFPVRILLTARPADLALLQMERLAGSVPTIGRLNSQADTIETGRPVAVLGFPLGGIAGSEEITSTVPQSITSVGILSLSSSSSIEVEAYGAEGSSGSPILDENGELIGVLYGGRDVDGQRRLLASPTRHLIALLAQR